MTVYEFIKYTEDNPNNFICYCEIIIGIQGEVYLAHPCHQYKLLELAARKYNITINDYENNIPIWCSPTHWVISKEHFISVWYDRIIAPKRINKNQQKTLLLLSEKKIIKSELFYDVSREYQIYLARKLNKSLG